MVTRCRVFQIDLGVACDAAAGTGFGHHQVDGGKGLQRDVEGRFGPVLIDDIEAVEDGRRVAEAAGDVVDQAMRVVAEVELGAGRNAANQAHAYRAQHGEEFVEAGRGRGQVGCVVAEEVDISAQQQAKCRLRVLDDREGQSGAAAG